MDVIRTAVAVAWAVVRGTAEAACIWLGRIRIPRTSVPDGVFFDVRSGM